MTPYLSGLVSTVFGLGKIPVMPGTISSLCAVIIGFPILSSQRFLLLFLVLFLFLLGWQASHIAIQNRKNKDPQDIVIDEWAGQWFALTFIQPSWAYAVLCFILFRFFDILKPWPISAIEAHLKSSRSLQAFGIMADDLLAGLFAGLATFGIEKIIFITIP